MGWLVVIGSSDPVVYRMLVILLLGDKGIQYGWVYINLVGVSPIERGLGVCRGESGGGGASHPDCGETGIVDLRPWK